MTTSEYEGLSLQERERYWLKALEQKSTDGMLTEDQWWYEWPYQVIYEDENILLSKEYVNELSIVNKKRDDIHGIDGCFEVMMREDLGGRYIQLEGYEGRTIVDYMRERGFPLAFLTWI